MDSSGFCRQYTRFTSQIHGASKRQKGEQEEQEVSGTIAVLSARKRIDAARDTPARQHILIVPIG